MTKQCVFLDRDGVINRDNKGYVGNADDWVPIPGSIEAIAKLNQADYDVFVITNQSGIGRGYYSLDDMHCVNDKMRRIVKTAGGLITDIFYCPHSPEAQCGCRKPRSGLFIQCQQKYKVEFVNTPFVGDKLSDLRAAEAIKAMPILVETGKGMDTLKSLPSDHSYSHYKDLQHFVECWLAGQ